MYKRIFGINTVIMGLLIGFIILLLLLSWAVARSVYRKLKKEERDPWVWTVASFLLTALLVLGAGYLLIIYLFSFER